MRLKFAIAAILVLGCQVSPVTAGALRFSNRDGDKIGSQAVGLVCFPKQSLRWSRQYRPQTDELEDVLRRKFGPRAESISAEVTELRIRVCQPYWGPVGSRIGNTEQLKGEIEMRVSWTLAEQGGCKDGLASYVSHVQRKITPEMRGGIAGLILIALDVSADDFAENISHDGQCQIH